MYIDFPEIELMLAFFIYATLSCIMLKNGQTYFNFKSMFGHFSLSCMKELRSVFPQSRNQAIYFYCKFIGRFLYDDGQGLKFTR